MTSVSGPSCIRPFIDPPRQPAQRHTTLRGQAALRVYRRADRGKVGGAEAWPRPGGGNGRPTPNPGGTPVSQEPSTSRARPSCAPRSSWAPPSWRLSAVAYAIAANAPTPQVVSPPAAAVAVGARRHHARARARHPRTPAGGPIGVPAAKKLGAERVDRRRRGRGRRHPDRRHLGGGQHHHRRGRHAEELPHGVADRSDPAQHLGQQRRTRSGGGQLGHLPARHRRQAQRLQPAGHRQRDHGRDRLLRGLRPRRHDDDHDDHDARRRRRHDRCRRRRTDCTAPTGTTLTGTGLDRLRRTSRSTSPSRRLDGLSASRTAIGTGAASTARSDGTLGTCHGPRRGGDSLVARTRRDLPRATFTVADGQHLIRYR